MFDDEEEVIHLDYNSMDEYEIPESGSEESYGNDDGKHHDDEEESESRLMEYLLKGYVLQSDACTKCHMPLIKSISADVTTPSFVDTNKIEPVGNVCFCVTCSAHVVTTKEELQILSLDKNKAVMDVPGAVIMLIDDAVDDHDDAVDDHDDQLNEKTDKVVGKEDVVEDFIIKTEQVEPALDSSMSSQSGIGVDDVNKTAEEFFNYELYDLISFDKRRSIATKVLGTKMIAGYRLKEAQCDKCTMPFMEAPDKRELLCVVCPVLQKKIMKKVAEREQKEKALAAENDTAMKRVTEHRVLEKEVRTERNEYLLGQSEAETSRQYSEPKPSVALESEDIDRKIALQRQIKAEKRRLEEMKFKRQIQEQNLDEEEQMMLIELRRAKEEREREEERLQEEARKYAAEQKRKAAEEQRRREEERQQLIEELRAAKEARAIEEKRRNEELKLAEQRAQEAKKEEEKREAERMKLIEELKIERQERMMEETKRKEEALNAQKRAEEAEKLIKLRDEEQLRMKTELENSFRLQKQQEDLRKAEIEKAEIRAKKAEEKLRKWRHEAEIEAKRTEEVRQVAEKRAQEAERVKIEAQNLAAEAKDAQRLAMAEQRRLSEQQRLNELSHRAEKQRLFAEAEAQRAQKALLKAEQMAHRYSQESAMQEGTLTRQLSLANHDLSRFEQDDDDFEHFEEGLTDDYGFEIDVPDDRSYSSRVSITIELPENFDPTDPNSMAQLTANAAAAVSSGNSIRSNARSMSRPSSRVSRSRELPRTSSGRIPQHPSLRSGFQNSTRSMTRNPESSFRSRSRPRSRSRSVGRNPKSIYVTEGYGATDEDELSEVSDNHSVARSVASHTLDAIMSKIDDCKAKLIAPIDNSDAASVASKQDAAALMQKLIAAANAVKDVE